ncbi:MAG: RnfABCDGE type electron transport complex subunit G [Alphaproteobacteria bacterium]|nr:RnfABCDGE type electron transport complex subunit G [Alphaproteobacteria bacterium]MBQ7285684.1 RnfABCDGE type electron transport complex subunit G [Alphaproteobacteria bacterium]
MVQKKSTFWNMILTLTIISLTAAFILSFVEQLTEKPIKEAKNAHELDAIASVVQKFNNNPFAEKLTINVPGQKNGLELYPARLDGNINSFAIKTYSNNGFAGRIELIVGFLMDGTINNFVVTRSLETPGLGSKVNDEKFKSQFRGFNPNRQILKVRQDGGEIDAVTAATISSRAVTNAIQKAVDAYHNFHAGK